METNKLKAKDLINVGIYTAIYIVIFFVVGMLNAIPVLYPFLYVLIPLISGIPFMLFLTKTEKFGMVTIMSVICGIFWFLIAYEYLNENYSNSKPLWDKESAMRWGKKPISERQLKLINRMKIYSNIDIDFSDFEVSTLNQYEASIVIDRLMGN